MSLSPLVILTVIVAYFAVLIGISYLTSKDQSNDSFFKANGKSPWYLVAFGMIGASLSGVTFISVPGMVDGNQFSYFQMVLGYLVGYFVIATVLMPLYYRLNLTSIYGYLDQRLGKYSYKTGAGFFLLSRTIQAAFRLFLVAVVLHQFVMSVYGIPFWATVMITIILIWLYTHRAGIKTIVWTDTLQTTFMLSAVIMTIIAISQAMDLSVSGLIDTVSSSEYSQIFFFEGGWGDSKNFFKQFIAGAFIAIVMTGLDQDMMQKNLTCKNIGEAQKNMFWFSIVLLIANLLFLSLGALLYLYASQLGLDIPAKSDLLYPTIALNHLSPALGIIFILGLIAAAYSSADSALTALTTSFCIDFLGFERDTQTNSSQKRTRTIVHITFSFLLFFVILIFYYINDDAVITAIFKAASYTYGPLLGLFAFGFYTKRNVKDKLVPFICVFAPILTYLINSNSEALLFGYKFGFELLLLNGLITFIGLWAISTNE